MKPTLLVLAAGMGSRYGGLKQIDPVGPSGEFIIDYSIYDALEAGFDKVVFVIRRGIEEEFKRRIGGRYEAVVDVDYAYQELSDVPVGFSVPEERAKPWGTGHAVLAGRSAVRTPFAVINADDFYGRGGYRLLQQHLSSATDVQGVGNYAMVGFVLRNTLSEHGAVSRGLCRISSAGFLQEVKEATDIEKAGRGARYDDEEGRTVSLSGDEVASMNMWGLTPSIFDYLDGLFRDFLRHRGAEPRAEFYIPTAVAELVSRGLATVRVMESRDSWFGITYREDKQNVQRCIQELVRQGTYPESLFDAWRNRQ